MLITKEFKYRANKLIEYQYLHLICDNCNKEYNIVRYSLYLKGLRKFGKDLCLSCKATINSININWSNYNKLQKGKTFEERFGEEKALIIKKKQSKTFEERYGEEGAQLRKEKIYTWSNYNKLQKGKTFEERFGEEKALIIKKKLSKANSGENNSMYGKPSTHKSGYCLSGYYKNYYFRSSYELSYIKYLIDNNIKFETCEQKKYEIFYEKDNIKRTYFPDFYLIKEDLIVEIKPIYALKYEINKLKFSAAKEKLGNKFKVLTEKDLNLISKEEIQKLIDNKTLFLNKKIMLKFQNAFTNIKKQG